MKISIDSTEGKIEVSGPKYAVRTILENDVVMNIRNCSELMYAETDEVRAAYQAVLDNDNFFTHKSLDEINSYLYNDLQWYDGFGNPTYKINLIEE